MAITINDQEPFDSNSPLTIIKALSNLATQIRLLSGSGSWNEPPSTNLNQLSIPGWNIISTNSNLAKNQNNLIKVSGLVITVPIGLNQGDFFAITSIAQNTYINLNGYSYQGNNYPVTITGVINLARQPQIYIYDSAIGLIDLTGSTITFNPVKLIGTIFSTTPFDSRYPASAAFDGDLTTTFGSTVGAADYIGMNYANNVYLAYFKFAPMLLDPTFGSQYAYELIGTEVQGLGLDGNWITFYTIQQSDFPPAGQLATIQINSTTPCSAFRFYNSTTSPNVSEIEFWGYYV